VLIDLFEATDWSQFLSTNSWREDIIKNTSGTNTLATGATFTVVQIYQDRFECSWIGDSSAKIYEGASLLWRTEDHNYNNKNDYKTMLLDDELFPNLRIIATNDIQATTPTIMLSVPAKIFRMGVEGINMTRALGHQGRYAKYGFDTAIIPRKNEETYKIVTATDGFWQVMCDEDELFIMDNGINAQHLAKKARERWEQAWIHDDSQGHITENAYLPSHNWDDIGVTIWSN